MLKSTTKELALVYQFKITLNNTRPAIWRRIQVPSAYSFWDLHVAIQDAMGWSDYHLHEFEITNPQNKRIISIGIPSKVSNNNPTAAEWRTPIKKYFSTIRTKATYLYDFGDSWEHKIVLEKILPANPLNEYPTCIGGERACPPEDCGGTYGYKNYLKIMADPSHEEHEEIVEWMGEGFNPETFSINDVEFTDPRERLAEL